MADAMDKTVENTISDVGVSTSTFVASAAEYGRTTELRLANMRKSVADLSAHRDQLLQEQLHFKRILHETVQHEVAKAIEQHGDQARRACRLAEEQVTKARNEMLTQLNERNRMQVQLSRVAKEIKAKDAEIKKLATTVAAATTDAVAYQAMAKDKSEEAEYYKTRYNELLARTPQAAPHLEAEVMLKGLAALKSSAVEDIMTRLDKVEGTALEVATRSDALSGRQAGLTSACFGEVTRLTDLLTKAEKDRMAIKGDFHAHQCRTVAKVNQLMAELGERDEKLSKLDAERTVSEESLQREIKRLETRLVDEGIKHRNRLEQTAAAEDPKQLQEVEKLKKKLKKYELKIAGLEGFYEAEIDARRDAQVALQEARLQRSDAVARAEAEVHQLTEQRDDCRRAYAANLHLLTTGPSDDKRRILELEEKLAASFAQNRRLMDLNHRSGQEIRKMQSELQNKTALAKEEVAQAALMKVMKDDIFALPMDNTNFEILKQAYVELVTTYVELSADFKKHLAQKSYMDSIYPAAVERIMTDHNPGLAEPFRKTLTKHIDYFSTFVEEMKARIGCKQMPDETATMCILALYSTAEDAGDTVMTSRIGTFFNNNIVTFRRTWSRLRYTLYLHPLKTGEMMEELYKLSPPKQIASFFRKTYPANPMTIAASKVMQGEPIKLSAEAHKLKMDKLAEAKRVEAMQEAHREHINKAMKQHAEIKSLLKSTNMVPGVVFIEPGTAVDDSDDHLVISEVPKITIQRAVVNAMQAGEAAAKKSGATNAELAVSEQRILEELSKVFSRHG